MKWAKIEFMQSNINLFAAVFSPTIGGVEVISNKIRLHNNFIRRAFVEKHSKTDPTPNFSLSLSSVNAVRTGKRNFLSEKFKKIKQNQQKRDEKCHQGNIKGWNKKRKIMCFDLPSYIF